jgi:lysophospholipase L1-like esterase
MAHSKWVIVVLFMPFAGWISQLPGAQGDATSRAVTTRGAASFPSGAPAKLILKKGDFVVMMGDSITAQSLYTRMIEDYLVACRPDLDLRCMHLGFSGDVSWGMASRIDVIYQRIKPTVATFCYGMNDGRYRELNQDLRTLYFDGMTANVAKSKAIGATVVVGSPGAVDSFFFNKVKPFPDSSNAEVYNAALGELAGIARKVAAKEGQVFADVHTPLLAVMAAAKRDHGQEFPVCGDPGGVHPGPNGHVVMAYVFLRAMGLDGQIGTITADMAGTAQGSDGHKVLSAGPGVVELESTRYPFCFTGDLLGSTKGDFAASALPYVPFSRDLNRLTLVVRNLKGERAKVTWGSESKTFTRAELTRGVNLAEEFRENPFCEAFGKVDKLVAEKQAFDYQLIIGMKFGQDNGKALSAEDRLALEKLIKRQREMTDQVRALITPVKHTIKIE